MTHARRPHFIGAFADLGAAIVCLALGFLAAPWPACAIVVAAHLSYWAYTRRRALAGMALARALISGAVAIAMIIGIDVFAFLFSTNLREMT